MVLTVVTLRLALILLPVVTYSFWLAFFQRHTPLQGRSWVFLDTYA
jgi:hypothetical protein